jgi:L-amino acid N-acyltransferase YncA
MMIAGKSDVVVRTAGESDVAAIADLYGQSVATGTASWELTPPGADEMVMRFRAVTGHGYPYLVAVVDGCVVGYSHAGAYRPRPGYRHTVEDSVYVAPLAQRRGVGRSLLSALIEECALHGYRQMVAVIGDATNAASIRLHAALGFAEVGRLPAIGRKFDRWLDSVMLQRSLGEGATTPPARD